MASKHRVTVGEELRYDSDFQGLRNLSGTYAPTALPSNRTGIKRFDPQRGLYNWHVGNTRNWRAALALAKQGTANAVLNCYGDSITYGQHATPPFSGGWVGRLRSKIDTYLGASAGTGVAWVWNGYRSEDTRLAFNGGAEVDGYGPFTKSCYVLSTGADYITLGPVSCDSFKIYYIGQVAAGRTIGWSVDGGSETNISASGQSENTHVVSTVSAGSLGSHTLKVRPTGSGPVYIVGIEAIIGTAGVRVTSVGYPGFQSLNLDDPSFDGHASYEYAYADMVPNLSIYMFGSNEFNGQGATSGYYSVLAGEIAWSQQYGDVLLVTTVPRDKTSPTIPQDSYHQVCYSLADALDLPVLDIAARWGGTTGAYTNLYHESVGSRAHPNNAGYRDVADAVYDAIMPR